jgi:hypothetical protein
MKVLRASVFRLVQALGLMLSLAATGSLAEEAIDLDKDARQVAMEFAQRLSASLKQELTAGGPVHAIGICRDLAPSIAAELSRSKGWKVSRVSLKVRNPLLGSPDEWEQAALIDFDRRAASGQKLDAMEMSEVVSEPQGRFARYIKAIPVQPLCLTCHGAPEDLDPSVRARLAADYPHDQATGYRQGMIRGGIAIKRALP